MINSADNNTRPKVQNWDGPLYRLFLCGEAEDREGDKEHRHRLALDAVDLQGAWMMTLSGRGYYEVANLKHTLSAGTVLALPRPARGELIHPAGGQPWRSIWIHVAGASALEFFNFITAKYGIIHKLPLDCQALKKARMLVRMARSGKSCRPQECSIKTFDFLNAWWMCCEDFVLPSAHLTNNNAYDSKLLSFKPGSVQEYAHKMGYSRSYLARKLKEQWKEPPGRVLRRARLEEAARLLRVTDIPVKDIADEVGYQSNTAFIRAFKALYKKAPLQYRHQKIS